MREVGTVLTDGLNVHDKPGGREIDALKKGDAVNVLQDYHRGAVGEWRKIDYVQKLERKIGWVMVYNLSTRERYLQIRGAPERKPEPLPPPVEQGRREPWPIKQFLIFGAVAIPVLSLMAWCSVQ